MSECKSSSPFDISHWSFVIAKKIKRQRTNDKGQRTVFNTYLLPFAFCLLTSLSCSPSRVSTVSADATKGYCPVCKMDVKADGEWTAEIYYNDGTKLMFESPGDMLAFYFAPEKYNASDKQKDQANIEKVLVKDYQSKKQIEARQASLVYDSNVKSNMGPELIPLGTRTAAEEFVAKNGGKVLTWNEVTAEMVRNLRK